MVVEAKTDALRLTGTVIRLVRYLDKRMGESVATELTLQELTVVGAIDRGLTLASAIARSLQLDPPRVTRIVERLVALGYVERGEDASDRRRCPLSVTPSGRKILTEARQALADGMTEILEQLPGTQRDHLIDSLEDVRLVLEK